MRGKDRTFSEALSRLRDQASKGRSALTAPTELLVMEVREVPLVFQHRRPHASDSKAHVATLTALLKPNSKKRLEAISIWWTGKHWVCIDGHHRLAAYRKALGVSAVVPVSVFHGTLDEAITQAAQGNTRSTLPMTAREKTRAAWRLVCTTDRSKAQIVEACGVGDGTVAAMRRVLHRLGGGAEACDMPWEEARMKARGLDMPESPEFDDEAKQKLAEAWALQMRKVLPRGFENKTDILAIALEVLSPRIPARLRDEWGWLGEEEDEGGKDTEF